MEDLIVQQIILGVVLVALVVGLVADLHRPSMLFFLAVLVLTTTGIIAPDEMISGFSNSQIATVVLLLIIGNIINQTTIIPWLFDKVFRSANNYRKFLRRLMISVGAVSPFMNNTPLVAMLIPYVYRWGQQHGVSPSKLLIPLSFATIAGGMVTIFGTSTNLIVNGLLQNDQLPVFEVFDFAPVGIVVTILVFLYMAFIGHRLLPEKRDPVAVVQEESTPFLTQISLRQGSALNGRTVAEITKDLKGITIVGLWNGRNFRTPVQAHDVLREGSLLLVKGSTGALTALLDSGLGIGVTQVQTPVKGQDLDLVEVVVSYNSSLAQKTIAEAQFKNLYDAHILAIHRPDENIHEGLEQAVLQPGDVLMVLAASDVRKRFEETTDFHVVNKESTPPRIGGWKAWAVGLSFVLILLLNVLEVASLFTLCLWLGGLYYLLRVTSFRTIQRMLDADLILVLAFSIGLGKAIYNSGLADTMAKVLIENAGNFGIIGAMVAVYFLANLLTQLISNAASATIVYPVAISVAKMLDADVGMFAMLVAFAASLDFSTPIGYQTNLMVYGPGGYKFTDYLRVGVPLNLGLMVVVVGMIAWLYGVWG